MKAWLYHRIGIARGFSFDSGMDTLHLVGGCGELCRDIWYTDLKKVVGSPNAGQGDISLIRVI